MLRFLKCWRMSKASEAAQQLLLEIGYEDLVGQDLTQLVLSLGLYYEEAQMKGCEGRIVYSNSGRTVKITINSDIHYLPRKRFSQAHEIGHYLLDHHKVHYDNAGTLDCYNKSGPEAEANEFASELLMPTPSFMNFVTGKPFSPHLIAEIAEHFGTSMTSVIYRYMMCGPHPIAVVHSCKGVVKWMRKSKHMRRWLLDLKGLPVPANSVSEEYFHNAVQYGPDEVQDVELGVWFDLSRRYWEDVTHMCHEYCFISERYGGVTAVIWED